MRRDRTQAYDRFEKAAELSRRVLARYEERAPATLKPLFAALAADLFKPGLSLEAVLDDAGGADRSLWTDFAEVVGQPAWSFVREERLAVAARLLVATALSTADVALFVGYDSVSTFRGLFRSWAEARPGELRRRARRLLKRAGAPPRGIDRGEKWEQALAGELDDEEARDYYDYVAGFYPSAPGPEAEPDAWRRLRAELAEALADSLDELPWPDQRRLVREAALFPDGTFFDVLSRRGQEAGAPERGVELALLAVDSLAANGLLEVHPVAASLAWTRLALARWQAADVAGAEEALGHASQAFERTPAEDLEPLVEAERRRVEAAFRFFLGRREEALELARGAVAQYRAARSGDLVRALLLRAELLAAAGEAEGAFEDLEEVRDLLDAAPGPERSLFFEPWLRVLVDLGDRNEMAHALPDARRLAAELGDERLLPLLRWFEGHCASPGDRAGAESLWRQARAGFVELGEDLWAARTTLDLTVLCRDEGRGDEVPALAAELAASLGTLAGSAVSLAAATALRQTAQSGELTPQVLAQASAALSRLDWDARAREALRLAQ